MSSQKSSVVSTGRGGSGNIGSSSSAGAAAGPADLKTPHLKQPLFTTGRGGSGNMMINHPDLPEVTRAAQDADHAPTRHSEHASPQHQQHQKHPGASITTGRGGGGNMVRKQSYSGNGGDAVIEGRAVPMMEEQGDGQQQRQLPAEGEKRALAERERAAERERVAAAAGGSGGLQRKTSDQGASAGERQGRRSNFVEGAMGVLSKVRGSSKSKDRSGGGGKGRSDE